MTPIEIPAPGSSFFLDQTPSKKARSSTHSRWLQLITFWCLRSSVRSRLGGIKNSYSGGFASLSDKLDAVLSDLALDGATADFEDSSGLSDVAVGAIKRVLDQLLIDLV